MSLSDLQVGDVLLYFDYSLVDWIIALKTYNLVGHIEIYAGGGKSIASRNGVGVNIYPLRTQGLVYVRRSFEQINVERAMEWFWNEARGQKYDWKGLFCFTFAVKQGSPNKMFCSEFGTRWFRKGCINIVADDYDADKTAPAQFLQSPALRTIWSKWH